MRRIEVDQGRAKRRHGRASGNTLHEAGHQQYRPGYVVQIATADGGPVATSSGVRLMADLTLDEVNGRVDTLPVSGAVDLGEAGVEPVLDGKITDWLREAAPRARTGSNLRAEGRSALARPDLSGAMCQTS
ncbi:hypothetical protein ACFO9E_11390 [Streptomyces maoxianensis]|uniref:Uncharacterized protein n=1 Tax=Streptomyces maoxianensis TaxID=1459942 RepID=A0ABV9G683_9ACTN